MQGAVTDAIEFERTKDLELVGAIVRNPRIYEHLCDDFSPKISDWQPVANELVWYVLAWDASQDPQELLGAFILIPQNHVCWEVHTCLLPNAWGPRAVAAAKAGQEWVWANTDCQRLVTNVPSYNVLARRFAQVSGMKAYGINPKSYQKDNKLWDQIMLGISRP